MKTLKAGERTRIFPGKADVICFGNESVYVHNVGEALVVFEYADQRLRMWADKSIPAKEMEVEMKSLRGGTVVMRPIIDPDR